MKLARSLLLICLCIASYSAVAHRLSPAYFGLEETAPDVFAAQWKVSISGGLADVLEPVVPENCAVIDAARSYTVDDARLVHASLSCADGLAGKLFHVDGLPATDTDVLLRIDYLDGSSFTHRLVPDSPEVLIPERQGMSAVAVTYFVIGVEHILLGIDHLLFVLALLLLVRGFGRLVATITAFTLAHSVTLAAATLGFVSVPSAPVEACIALSILFLASEVARRTQNCAGTESATLASRFPWLVAFTFGLLHGFGFAGALSEVGLPANAIPLALLFFNVGVEAGQIAFVLAVMALAFAFRQRVAALPPMVARPLVYGIGCVAAFWFVERSVLSL